MGVAWLEGRRDERGPFMAWAVKPGFRGVKGEGVPDGPITLVLRHDS